MVSELTSGELCNQLVLLKILQHVAVVLHRSIFPAISLFGVTSTTVARSLIHSSSVIGLSEMIYLPIACSMF